MSKSSDSAYIYAALVKEARLNYRGRPVNPGPKHEFVIVKEGHEIATYTLTAEMSEDFTISVDLEQVYNLIQRAFDDGFIYAQSNQSKLNK